MVGVLMLLAAVAGASPASSDPAAVRVEEQQEVESLEPASFRSPGKYLVPAVETGALLIGINRVDDWALNGKWARVSLGSITDNVNAGLRLDNDDIFVNFLGHPFQGSIPFGAARSTGLSFWTASAYTIASDLIWEFVAEIQAPSTNDLIETGLGGVVWGEALHRLSRLILENTRLSWLARVLAAFLLNPAGAVNYAAAGSPPGAVEAPAWHGRLYVGGLVLERPSQHKEQILLGADVSYGFPDAPSTACVLPFEVMDVRADAGFRDRVTLDGSVRGLIAGCHLGGEVPGAWGMFGMTDFRTGPGFRLASSGLGAGALAQWRFGDVRLRATAVLGGTAMAASGLLVETDYADPNSGIPPLPSLYSMGPGAQAIGDVELALGPQLSLRAIGRSWWIASITPLKGLERADTASFGAFAWLPAGQFLGAEVSLDQRLSAQDRDPPVRGWTARAIWGARLGTEPGP